MHPDVIRALARERHAELLRDHHSRDSRHGADAPASHLNRRRRPVRHLRRSLGSALVQAGSRLMAPNHAAADWAVHASRDSTRQ